MPLTFTCPACGAPFRLHAPYPVPGTELKCSCGLTLALTFPPGLMARLRAEGARFVEDLPEGQAPASAPAGTARPPGGPARPVAVDRTGRPRRSARRRTRRLALLLFTVGCASESSSTWNPCDVTLTGVEPPAGPAGSEAAVSGSPFTDAWDTAIYVGSVRATIVGVERMDCDPWEECVAVTGCNPCADCDACDPDRSACRESATFVVPDMAPGATSLHLFNRHGESNALPFTVEAPPDDSGGSDSGDTGSV